PVTLVNSTVSGNRDGVIVADSATLVNSTISGNTGGGIVADGLVELSNVTVTDNGGGGGTAGSIVLRHTIVAAETPPGHAHGRPHRAPKHDRGGEPPGGLCRRRHHRQRLQH